MRSHQRGQNAFLNSTPFHSTVFHSAPFYSTPFNILILELQTASLVSRSYSQPLEGRRDALVLDSMYLQQGQRPLYPSLESFSHVFKKCYFLSILYSHSPPCHTDNHLNVFSIYHFVSMFLENAFLCLSAF